MIPLSAGALGAKILEFLGSLSLSTWLLIGAAGFALERHLEVHDLRADVATLSGEKSTLEAEKVALQERVDAAETGRAAALKVAEDRLAILEAERREARRLDEEGRAAILAAEQARIDAERTLGEFIDRYADEVRKPDCAAALDRLEAQCSALSDY